MCFSAFECGGMWRMIFYGVLSLWFTFLNTDMVFLQYNLLDMGLPVWLSLRLSLRMYVYGSWLCSRGYRLTTVVKEQLGISDGVLVELKLF